MIDFKKFETKSERTEKTQSSGIDFSKFRGTKTKAYSKSESEIVTLPDFLGGGSYKQIPGKPGVLIKTERSTYGGLDTKSGYERADIVPVSLGGINSSDKNIIYQINSPEFNKIQDKMDKGEKLTSKEGSQLFNRTYADKYLMEEVLPKYKSGEISLPQARLRVLTFQQQHYDSYGDYHSTPGTDINGEWTSQGTKENLWGSVKDMFKHPIKTMQKAVGANPNTADTAKDLWEQSKKTPFDLDLKKAGGDFIKAFDEAGTELIDRTKKLFSHTETKSEKFGDILEEVSGIAGVVFSPITATFSASKEIPVIGAIADVFELPLSLIADTSNNLTESGLSASVASGIMSQQTADNIKQGVNEIMALAGQIYVGGKAFEGKKLDLKKKELTKKYGAKDAETIIIKAKELAKRGEKEFPKEEKPKIDFKKFEKKEGKREIKKDVVKIEKKSVTSKKSVYVKEKRTGEITRVDFVKSKTGKEPTIERYLQKDDGFFAFIDGKKRSSLEKKHNTTDEGTLARKIATGDKGLSETISSSKIVKPKEVNVKKTPELKYESLERTSGLAKSVKSKAIRDKLIYGFDKELRNLPTYEKRIKVEDIKKTTEYVMNNPKEAYEVAMGEKPAPPGMLPEDVYVQVNRLATELRDIKTIKDLATRSKLLGEDTLMGQRIQALSQLNKDSALGRIQDVSKAREAKAKKVNKKDKAEVEKIIKEETKKTNLSKEELKWDNFLSKIKC